MTVASSQNPVIAQIGPDLRGRLVDFFTPTSRWSMVDLSKHPPSVFESFGKPPDAKYTYLFPGLITLDGMLAKTSLMDGHSAFSIAYSNTSVFVAVVRGDRNAVAEIVLQLFQSLGLCTAPELESLEEIRCDDPRAQMLLSKQPPGRTEVLNSFGSLAVLKTFPPRDNPYWVANVNPDGVRQRVIWCNGFKVATLIELESDKFIATNQLYSMESGRFILALGPECPSRLAQYSGTLELWEHQASPRCALEINLDLLALAMG